MLVASVPAGMTLALLKTIQCALGGGTVVPSLSFPLHP